MKLFYSGMQGCCSLEEVPTARISDAQAEVVLGGQRVSPRLSLCLSVSPSVCLALCQAWLLLPETPALADGTLSLPGVVLDSKLCGDKPSLLSLPPLGWVVGRVRTQGQNLGLPRAFLDGPGEGLEAYLLRSVCMVRRGPRGCHGGILGGSISETAVILSSNITQHILTAGGNMVGIVRQGLGHGIRRTYKGSPTPLPLLSFFFNAED